MDLDRRLIGASAVFSVERKVTDVDVDGLVRRLLLFDKYVLASIRLQEFPFLVKYLGYEGLRDLLSANLIEVRCECLQLSQTAQSGIFGDPVLPNFSYKFHWLDAQDRSRYVHECFQGLHSTPGLQHKQVVKLKGLIAKSIRRLPEDLKAQVYPTFQNELVQNQKLVRTAVGMMLLARHGVADVPFSLVVHPEPQDTFKVETDIHLRTGITELDAHKIVEAGIMGIAGLSQTIAEMKCYRAISGFRDEDLPLFRHKLDFLADAASSQKKEEGFRRVIEIAGLPDFPLSDGAANVDKLLRVRDSNEAREFRDWLGGIGTVDEDEIKERVAGLRSTIGLKIGCPIGRAMRFLVNSGLSLIPQAIVPALALSVFDQFVLDRLLPRSGIAAFVNELYPSIFDPKE